MMLGALVSVCALAAAMISATPAEAAPAVPPGFVLRDQPSGQAAFDLTDFSYLPDDSTLTTGKKGTVAWVSKDGRTRTLASLPVDTAQDLGLVGLAVAPDYATSHQIYLVRSIPTGTGHVLRLARWTVTGSPEPTGISQEQVILEFPSNSSAHGMTSIVPGKDGSLWVSIGDLSDFSRTDPGALQTFNLDAPNGKILHITPDGRGMPDNPYYQASNPSSWRSRTYASGFRSPFRMSLDPATGTPVVGDVGYNTWEEVDIVRPGQHYKWPCWEGNHPTPGYADLPECQGVVNTPPLWEYHHGGASDQGNSVTGGIVYNGDSYPPPYRGAYFFGDYVGKKLWTLRYDDQGNLTRAPENPPFGTDIGGPVKFAAAPNGDIVYADIYAGTLHRLSYAQGNSAPVAKAQTTTDPATRTVTFDGSGSLDFDGDPLTYRWDFGDGATGTGPRATHTYAPGTDRFNATLTVTDPLGASDQTSFVVAPSNRSPEVTLTAPGQPNYAVHDPIALSAQATDAEDGPLTITWTSATIHCPQETTCHAHPGPGGTGPTFSSQFTDHPDSRMEFTATATDSAGVVASKTYVALPREHKLTLTSNVPAVLQVPAEGGDSSVMVTEGATFDVVAAQTATDGVATFNRWTDGVSTRTRTITMPANDLTLAAEYLTPIDRRYAAEPGLQSLLGAPTGPEIAEGGVRYRTYQGGRLYWTPSTGVKEVHGRNLGKYLRLGGHGRFGAPTTDETSTSDGVGRYNHFTGGLSIYFTPSTDSQGVWGAIRERWAALGWEQGPMGYPLIDETSTPDGVGRYNHFSEGGSVYWTPGTGAHGVWGGIRQRWAALGWEQGPMGYPLIDETSTPDEVGRYNHFSKGGSVYWTPSTGAHGVWGAIRELWSQIGWERGPMGYPLNDETATPDGVGRYNHFSKAGSIYWTPQTGAHEVYGAIRQRWSALGWERSYLGYPTSGEFSIPGGRRNNFERGFIEWYASNNAVIDRRY